MAPIGKAQWEQLCRCESWSGAALTENARATAARDRARPLSRGTVHRRGLELGESGRTISLEAPGATLYNQYPANRVPYSYYMIGGSSSPSTSYFSLSGTSMAAGVVSGAVADLLQKSAKHLVPAIKLIARADATLWEIDAHCYTEPNIRQLLDTGRVFRPSPFVTMCKPCTSC